MNDAPPPLNGNPQDPSSFHASLCQILSMQTDSTAYWPCCLARLAARARSRHDSAPPPGPAPAAAAGCSAGLSTAPSSAAGTTTAPSATARASRFSAEPAGPAAPPARCPAAAALLRWPPAGLAAGRWAPLLPPGPLGPLPPKMAAACDSSRSCCTAAAFACRKVMELRAPSPAPASSSGCSCSPSSPGTPAGGCKHWQWVGAQGAAPRHCKRVALCRGCKRATSQPRGAHRREPAAAAGPHPAQRSHQT